MNSLRFPMCVLIFVFSICLAISAMAQVNFLGGINDGFAKSAYVQPSPSFDIYAGGVNDGFVASAYIEPVPADDIYRGGDNDGFAFNTFMEANPANDIYHGGVNDGFAFNSYVQPNPAGDIYRGGTNDGFAKFFFSEELALPVHWNYFIITKRSGKPLLQWGSDGEEKCLSYEILRSHDGKDFKSISVIECQGNDFNNEYEFEDLSLLWHSTYYYKIAQYDIDGEFSYSDVRAFNRSEPFRPEVFYKSGQVIVTCDREAKLQAVAVYDFTGRTLCTQSREISNASPYSFNCQLSTHQLVIIHLRFDSFTHTTHMRIRE